MMLLYSIPFFANVVTSGNISNKLPNIKGDISSVKALIQILISRDANIKTTIGAILSIGSGQDYKHLLKGGIPVYGTGGYMLSVNKWLYDGDSVCIGRKGTIDHPFFVSGKFWTVDTLFYTHNFNGILPKYCFYLFRTIDWKKYNEASGVPSLSKKTIENIPIRIPNIRIQEAHLRVLESVTMKKNQEIAIMNKYIQTKAYLISRLFI